jgi:hypothetical protein
MTKRRSLVKLAAGVWPMCCLLPWARMARASFPMPRVDLEDRHAPPTFSLRVDYNPKLGPLLLSLTVTRKESRELLCTVTRKSGVKARRISSWRYGTPIEGFSSECQAKTLAPGLYLLSIDAEDARGWATFEVKANHEIVMVPS